MASLVPWPPRAWRRARHGGGLGRGRLQEPRVVVPLLLAHARAPPVVGHLVRQDTDDPRPHRRAPRERAGLAHRRQQRVLGEITRQLGVARGPQGEAEEHRLELPDLQLLQGCSIRLVHASVGPVVGTQVGLHALELDEEAPVGVDERHVREHPRRLQFFWSCDTRVDVLGDELLREMRLAGCQRLSLGVESGSPEIIKQIDKKITVKQIIQSTELAKKYGIKVRYFMMLGNRGETAETFRETLDFLKAAAPHEYIFSCLSIYPGTRDFDDAVKGGWLDPEVFFSSDFQELKTPFDASEADTALMNAWFSQNSGLRVGYREGAREYRAVLERLGDYHAAHMDVAGACYREGALDEAERHVRRALELGYPLPGLAHNYLGCIAKARGDVVGMMDAFTQAAKVDPQHHVLIKNVQAARAWFAAGGPGRGLPLDLVARHDFQLLERTVQPTLPGPLPEDFAAWTSAPPAVPAESYVKTPELEGSRAALGPRGRLKVITS
jgi:tetratricopeptide (TPR) repeat protein